MRARSLKRSRGILGTVVMSFCIGYSTAEKGVEGLTEPRIRRPPFGFCGAVFKEWMGRVAM